MSSGAQLTKRVALVAGGTGALGGAVSLALADAGADVVATYHHREEFDALAAKAKTSGQSSLAGVAVDTTDAAAVTAVVSKVVTEHGRLDIVVNAVGAYAGGQN